MTIHGVAIADAVAIHAEFGWPLAARCLLFAALAFAVLRGLARFASPAGRPRPPQAARRPLSRETLWSLSTILIAGGIAPIILLTDTGPQLNFYADIDEYGWTYFFGSIVLMMCLRDAHYCWMHQLLHAPRVFRCTHRTHHLSHQAMPLTGVSVRPIECLLLSVVPYTLILFFLPKHPTAYLLYIWLDATVTVYTHFGYEILPRGFSRHGLGRWVITSTAHQGHHRNARCNHGLYFVGRDRWLGTVDKDYDRQFDVATGTIPPPAAASTRC